MSTFLIQAPVNSSHKPGGKGHQQTDERLGPSDCPRSGTGECSDLGGGGVSEQVHTLMGSLIRTDTEMIYTQYI